MSQTTDQTLVHRLKSRVRQLEGTVSLKDEAILALKINVRATRVAQLEIYIQQMELENRRLAEMLRTYSSGHPNNFRRKPSKKYRRNNQSADYIVGDSQNGEPRNSDSASKPLIRSGKTVHMGSKVSRSTVDIVNYSKGGILKQTIQGTPIFNRISSAKFQSTGSRLSIKEKDHSKKDPKMYGQC